MWRAEPRAAGGGKFELLYVGPKTAEGTRVTHRRDARLV